MTTNATIRLDKPTVAALIGHMNKLRAVWMMAIHRPLNGPERNMLMAAIEAVEAALEPGGER